MRNAILSFGAKQLSLQKVIVFLGKADAQTDRNGKCFKFFAFWDMNNTFFWTHNLTLNFLKIVIHFILTYSIRDDKVKLFSSPFPSGVYDQKD